MTPVRFTPTEQAALRYMLEAPDMIADGLSDGFARDDAEDAAAAVEHMVQAGVVDIAALSPVQAAALREAVNCSTWILSFQADDDAAGKKVHTAAARRVMRGMVTKLQGVGLDVVGPSDF